MTDKPITAQYIYLIEQPPKKSHIEIYGPSYITGGCSLLGIIIGLFFGFKQLKKSFKQQQKLNRKANKEQKDSEYNKLLREKGEALLIEISKTLHLCDKYVLSKGQGKTLNKLLKEGESKLTRTVLNNSTDMNLNIDSVLTTFSKKLKEDSPKLFDEISILSKLNESFDRLQMLNTTYFPFLDLDLDITELTSNNIKISNLNKINKKVSAKIELERNKLLDFLFNVNTVGVVIRYANKESNQDEETKERSED